MAELVDAPGLGPGVFRDVQVQVLSPALFDVARHSSSMSRHFGSSDSGGVWGTKVRQSLMCEEKIQAHLRPC